ncbi:hypothetical protein Gpo141_00007573 [Globisporangium polare]
MFSTKSLLLLLVATLASTTATVSAQTFKYTFDPMATGGIQGHVKVKYDSSSDTKADVSTKLDFSKLDLAAVQKLDGNCTGTPTAYKWHIHVKWNSTKTSDSFAMCAKPATGNHYDPLFACGPNSEFAEDPTCIPKIASYACSPANYTANPLVCEKGDLSGKLGDLTLDEDMKVNGKWTDPNYPRVDENTAQWNIILHAVCGKNTPRIACALGTRDDNDRSDDHHKSHVRVAILHRSDN